MRLVYKDNEENIPNFDDIFRDDEEEDEVCANETVILKELFNLQ